jgi:hypothetical protein
MGETSIPVLPSVRFVMFCWMRASPISNAAVFRNKTGEAKASPALLHNNTV